MLLVCLEPQGGFPKPEKQNKQNKQKILCLFCSLGNARRAKQAKALFRENNSSGIFRRATQVTQRAMSDVVETDDDAGDDGEARKYGRGGVFKMRESYKVLERVHEIMDETRCGYPPAQRCRVSSSTNWRPLPVRSFATQTAYRNIHGVHLLSAVRPTFTRSTSGQFCVCNASILASRISRQNETNRASVQSAAANIPGMLV